MNGEAGPLKEDLSTFNIEILQISKRIAPKSGLRGKAPHPPTHSQPALALGCPAVISFGTAAWGSAAFAGPAEEIAPFLRLTPEAETWEASPLAGLAPRRPLLPRWVSHPLRSVLPLARP